MFGLSAACSGGVQPSQAVLEKARQEIIQTERDFNNLAEKQGLPVAFSHYADSSAVINRGGAVIHGKDSIRLYYQASRFKSMSLTWEPDFAAVSSSADLGYTYGKYLLTARDSTGKETRSRGIFHTVWKKQSDGQWRFVWD